MLSSQHRVSAGLIPQHCLVGGLTIWLLSQPTQGGWVSPKVTTPLLSTQTKDV